MTMELEMFKIASLDGDSNKMALDPENPSILQRYFFSDKTV